MASSKHPKTTADRESGLGADTPRPPDDLARNPGIGASKGTQSRSAGEPADIEAANTSEGDVMNDVTQTGGVNPDQRGRTNK